MADAGTDLPVFNGLPHRDGRAGLVADRFAAADSGETRHLKILKHCSTPVQISLGKVSLYSPTSEPYLMETLLILMASVAMIVGPTLLVPNQAADDEED